MKTVCYERIRLCALLGAPFGKTEMLRGLYSATTAMLTQTKRMDVVSNNLANVDTVGFKKDKFVSRSFPDMLIERINDRTVVGAARMVGPYNTGIHVDQVITAINDSGPLIETTNSTDVAIAGTGFFVVNTPEGERYTRDGSFVRDVNGTLTDALGNQVLGPDGSIVLEDDNFSVNARGEIYVGGVMVGAFRIEDFQNPGMMRKEGYNLYAYDGAAGDLQPFTGVVKQYFLEGSNVESGQEIVEMMELYRNYESNQRIVRMYDESLGKAVNDIARI